MKKIFYIRRQMISTILIFTMFIVTGIISAMYTPNLLSARNDKEYQTDISSKPQLSASFQPFFQSLFYRIFNNDWDYWTNPPNLYAIPDGNVGIGTTTPTQKLEVNGTVKASAFIGNGSKLTDINGTWNEENNWYSTSGKALTTESYVHIYKGNILRFWSSSNSLVGNIYGYATGSGGQLRIQADNGGDVVVVNDGGEGLIIKDNGKVGIGTNTPAYTLHVIGDIYCTGKLTSVGGNDPPYVLFNSETRKSITARVAQEVPLDKQNGAVLFWNVETNQFEVYLPATMEFRDLFGYSLTENQQNNEQMLAERIVDLEKRVATLEAMIAGLSTQK